MDLLERLGDYDSKHADSRNLALHIATVPLVLLATLTLAACLSFATAVALAIGLAILWCSADLRLGVVLAIVVAAMLPAAHALAAISPFWLALTAGGAILAAIGIQGAGHGREKIRVRFTGPLNFIVVLGREQLYLAPLFLAARALGLLGRGSSVTR